MFFFFLFFCKVSVFTLYSIEFHSSDSNNSFSRSSSTGSDPGFMEIHWMFISNFRGEFFLRLVWEVTRCFGWNGWEGHQVLCLKWFWRSSGVLSKLVWEITRCFVQRGLEGHQVICLKGLGGIGLGDGSYVKFPPWSRTDMSGNLKDLTRRTGFPMFPGCLDPLGGLESPFRSF